MRKFLHEKIKNFKNYTIWLIDKKDLNFFYRRRVRDKLKLSENLRNQKIINFKNKLTTSNYKKMENLLKQINKNRKKISYAFREMRKIKRAQVLISLVLIFSLVSFFYNPNIARADTTLTTTSYTTANVATWISNGGTLIIPGGVTATFAAGTYNLSSLNVSISGTLIPSPSSTSGTGATGVILNTSGNITINAGGSINGDGQGYAGQAYYSGSPQGQGSGEGGGTRGYFGGSAGAYGGAGGKAIQDTSRNTTTYGSQDTPATPGSAAGASNNYGVGASGGGAIKLIASGTVTNNGTISVNGTASLGGGGSGGSVWIIAGTFTGSNDATITANGGAGGINTGGGGGGGR
ncbi:MAG: hypothetical protein WCG28_04125, partial [bacterium]